MHLAMINYNYSLTEKLRLFLANISSNSIYFKGKTRLVRSLDNLLRKSSQSTHKTISSVNYVLDTRDLIDFRLFYFGVTETGVINYLREYIGDRDVVFWDIGANVGSVSLPLLNMCPQLTINAFEPSPPVFERLTNNLALNPSISDRINLLNIALSNFSGSVEFFSSAEPHNSGVGSLGKMHNTVNKAVEVSCYTGDDFIINDKLQQPSIIKIDVEGFEYEVIEGLVSLLKNSPAIQIIFEHEPYRIDERGLKRDSVVQLLKQLDFELYCVPEDSCNLKLIKFEEKMLSTHCDLLAMKTKVNNTN
jgi:FkbM family methyltransferase